ncbi:hypothetical protein H2200_003852 [Cladophialophora chaetospira]|uniref:DUF3669 domain-containing protein n=1 Tax=Cladophialophora chaetospira TaxID=386627 RepID=A0AA38XEZ8_9EURO|nr:hypothetical protein H2200_003852 [Cladophialophora chaetospira]
MDHILTYFNIGGRAGRTDRGTSSSPPLLDPVPAELRKNISIPAWKNWVQPSRDLFWSDLRQFFPEGYQQTYGLLSTRIHPIPAPVREAIFDVFAPKSLRSNKMKFLARSENKDCLIRIYLGRRQDRSDLALFKLRNFDLMVNEMEQLGLDTAFFAKVLAEALAVLHWKAKVDADDVEFVLGRAPVTNMPPTAANLEVWGRDSPAGREFLEFDCQQRRMGVWLLDFNQCKEFPESETGIKQLQNSFYYNDPYYPRPISDHPYDVMLWNTFKGAYLQTSGRLTKTDWPEKFVDAVEHEGKRRASLNSMFD